MNTQQKTNNKRAALIGITFFLLLSAPFRLLAQTTPYYLAGGLTDFSDQMIRQSNPVYVTLFNQGDSIIVSASPDEYKYASFYKRTHGEPFLRRTQQWGTSMPNFAFVYSQGFLLIEEGGSYLCFLKDSKTADKILSGDSKSFFRNRTDSLHTVLVNTNTRTRAENSKLADTKYKKIATAYIRGLHSKLNDPKLVSDIKKWAGNPNLIVIIQDANYFVARNQNGEALDKHIRAFIKYRKDGKCYIQWGMFGYESLGNGQFSKDMTTFTTTYQYINVPGLGEEQLGPGEAQEVECN